MYFSNPAGKTPNIGALLANPSSRKPILLQLGLKGLVSYLLSELEHIPQI